MVETKLIMTDDIFKKGQKTAIIAGSATIFFASLKAIVGLISGSVVLTADAIHSAADSFSTFLAWFGLKIAQKKPSKKFPYGYYKAESISSFLISGFILLAGYEIIKGSIEKITASPSLKIPIVALSVAILDALVMFFIGTYELNVGKKINSRSLIADGTESRTHIFSSSIVLVGLIASWLKIPYLEGIMGIVISIFIFKIGIESMKDSIFSLMDVSPNKSIERRVRNVLNKISGLQGYKDLKLRKSGPFIFGEAKVFINKSVNVARAHQIADVVERAIKEKVQSIDSFLVIVSPYQTKTNKLCIPIQKDLGLNSEISPYFGRADNFIFINITNGKKTGYYTKTNPFKAKPQRAGLNTALFILEEKIDILITQEIGPISLHTLRDNIVDVLKGQKGTVEDNIGYFLENKLQLLTEPTVQRT